MFTIGIIGTSAISHQFVEAAHQSQHYRLKAVYSRTLEKARDFATPYGEVALFTDWQAFLAADIDVVYIASPNSLHFEQARAVLAAGKHAIVEKPIVSRPEELEILHSLAKQHRVFLFEAARNLHEAAFATIRDFLAQQTILGASFSYAKYSSKMPELLAGRVPNVFSHQFSGGALMDLGIYAVYATVALLGEPSHATYTAQQLPNTVDLNGGGQLFYENYQVSIYAGKNVSSHLSSEIYTTTGTLTLNSCQNIQSAVFQTHTGDTLSLPLQASTDTMLEEVKDFAHVLQTGDETLAEKWLAQAHVVHQTLYQMRQAAGIVFQADLANDK